MDYELRFSEEAASIQRDLEAGPQYARKLKKVNKALGQLQTNPRHPGLNTHKYQSLQGPNKKDVFEAYVENDSPGSWRIWFWYGPEQGQITILSIGPHPD